MLEVIVIRELYTTACGYIAAYASGAVEAGTSTPVAEHEAMSFVVEGDRAHIVVQACFAAVPHVAHGKHEVGECRELYECIAPVALILTGREVLQLAAQGVAAIDFVLTFEHADIRTYHTSLSLYDSLIILLVHIHGIELEILGDTLLQLQVDILIIKLLAHLEE